MTIDWDRVEQLLKDEQQQQACWWYLSFVDSNHFLGGVIIWARGMVMAHMAATALELNPGGEMLAVEIPRDKVPPARYANRLLTKEQIQEFWPDAMRLEDLEKLQQEREQKAKEAEDGTVPPRDQQR